MLNNVEKILEIPYCSNTQARSWQWLENAQIKYKVNFH